MTGDQFWDAATGAKDLLLRNALDAFVVWDFPETILGFCAFIVAAAFGTLVGGGVNLAVRIEAVAQGASVSVRACFSALLVAVFSSPQLVPSLMSGVSHDGVFNLSPLSRPPLRLPRARRTRWWWASWPASSPSSCSTTSTGSSSTRLKPCTCASRRTGTSTACRGRRCTRCTTSCRARAELRCKTRGEGSSTGRRGRRKGKEGESNNKQRSSHNNSSSQPHPAAAAAAAGMDFVRRKERRVVSPAAAGGRHSSSACGCGRAACCCWGTCIVARCPRSNARIVWWCVSFYLLLFSWLRAAAAAITDSAAPPQSARPSSQADAPAQPLGEGFWPSGELLAEVRDDDPLQKIAEIEP